MLTCGVGGQSWILQQISMHTARKQLWEVRQQLTDCIQVPQILPRGVVKHQAIGEIIGVRCCVAEYIESCVNLRQGCVGICFLNLNCLFQNRWAHFTKDGWF